MDEDNDGRSPEGGLVEVRYPRGGPEEQATTLVQGRSSA